MPHQERVGGSRPCAQQVEALHQFLPSALPTRGNPTASRAGAAGFNQGAHHASNHHQRRRVQARYARALRAPHPVGQGPANHLPLHPVRSAQPNARASQGIGRCCARVRITPAPTPQGLEFFDGRRRQSIARAEHGVATQPNTRGLATSGRQLDHAQAARKRGNVACEARQTVS